MAPDGSRRPIAGEGKAEGEAEPSRSWPIRAAGAEASRARSRVAVVASENARASDRGGGAARIGAGAGRGRTNTRAMEAAAASPTIDAAQGRGKRIVRGSGAARARTTRSANPGGGASVASFGSPWAIAANPWPRARQASQPAEWRSRSARDGASDPSSRAFQRSRNSRQVMGGSSRAKGNASRRLTSDPPAAEVLGELGPARWSQVLIVPTGRPRARPISS